MASVNLGQKNLSAGTFTFGPLSVLATEKGIFHTWKKVSWTNDGSIVITYQYQYSLDNGVTWINFNDVVTVSAIAIPSKFGIPIETISVYVTVPKFGQARKVQAILTVSKACTLQMSGQTV